MKYFLRVLFVLVIAVAVVTGVYSSVHRDENASKPETTVSKAPATEKYSEKELLASRANDGIFLYKSNKSIILYFDSRQYVFENWSEYFNAEKPEIYYANFDDDEDNEIVIYAVDEINQSKKKLYGIYYLDPYVKDEKQEFSVSYLNANTYSEIINTMLREEISQLKFSKKLGQIAINYANSPIKYDEKTGIATGGHVGYFATLRGEDGKFMTIDKWSFGEGEYTVTADNKIFVDVPVHISYQNGADVQYAGDIHFQLVKNDKGEIKVGKNSLLFNTKKEYTVAEPKSYSRDKWSYTERNRDVIVDESDMKLDLISYKTNFDRTVEIQTTDFASSNNDMKNVSSIVVTESYVELTAKQGCIFGNANENGEFSVIIDMGGVDYDVAYEAQITTDKNNIQTLKITFERPISKNQIKTLVVNYGIK